MANFKSSAQHRDWLVDMFVSLFPRKYDDGQRRHGGKLYAKPRPLDEARQEVMDQWSYIETARHMWEQVESILEEGIKRSRSKSECKVAMTRALRILKTGNDQIGDV